MRMCCDHFMKLGWEILIPASPTWLVLIAVTQVVANFTDLSHNRLFVGIGAASLAVLALVLLFGEKGNVEGDEPGEAGLVRPSEEFDTFAWGFPVPPLPGQILPPSPRASRGTAPLGGPEVSNSGLSVSGKTGEPAESQPGTIASQAGSTASEAGGAAP